MTATLVMLWRWPNGKTMTEDFVFDGDYTTTTKAIAAHLEIVDSAAAFWRGVAGDWEREYLKEKAKLAAVTKELDFLYGVAGVKRGEGVLA